MAALLHVLVAVQAHTGDERAGEDLGSLHPGRSATGHLPTVAVRWAK